TTFAPFLLWAGVLSMVHAGCAALLQLDGRRLVGWLAMAGGAFALAGFAAGVSAEGRAPAGAVAWFVVAHAAACAMLLAVVAAFEARRGPMRLGAMGGVGRAMPLWAVAAVVAALAVIAAPATAGFPAQLELLAGIAGAPVAGRGWLMAIVV